MKTECGTEGCDNAVRPQMRHCDDCIVAEARRRTRRREETENRIRGGQGRSGAEVKQSAVAGGIALAGAVLLLVGLLAASLFDAGKEAGEAEQQAKTALEKVENGGKGAGR